MAEEKKRQKPQVKTDGGEANLPIRVFSGIWQKMFYALAVCAALFHIGVNTLDFMIMPAVYRNACHLGFIMAMGFLLYPWSMRSPRKGLRIDLVLVALTVAVTAYILLFQQELHLERNSIPIMRDHVFAVIAIVLLIICTWRTSGPVIPILSITFLAYALFLGKLIPGAFHYRGVSLGRLLYRMYLTDEGIFGSICTISSTYVFLFIMFGTFLNRSGAGEFIINLAQALAGRRIGGPAKIAVISSGFMGSVSGSAVANTVSTGTMTIPLMIRMGYTPAFAGAVEAAASTGGQLMPPIMGAGAFIMAQWTGISYMHIIAVATIPAILYFLTVGFFVHIESIRLGIKPAKDESIPKVREVMKQGAVFLIPVGLLVGLMIRGYSPTYAACAGMAAIVAVSWLRKETRMGPKAILDALADGAKSGVSTGAILICAGIVIAVTGITGIGVTFSSQVLSLAMGSKLLAIILVGLASLVLGMGLPVTASYIFLAVLAGPALEQLGMSLLAAHMIIYWFSQDANVTPPVCLAAYAAAGIARSKPLETGLISWKLAKGLYLVPLLFAYTPILFEGPVHEVVWITICSIFGLFGLVVALENHYLEPLQLWQRAMVGFTSLVILFPRILTRGILGLGGDDVAIQAPLTEAEKIAKAMADALGQSGMDASAAPDPYIDFWPNRVLATLAAVAVLALILLPQKMRALKAAKAEALAEAAAPQGTEVPETVEA